MQRRICALSLRFLPLTQDEKELKNLPNLEMSSDMQFLSRERLAAEREKDKNQNQLWKLQGHIFTSKNIAAPIPLRA